jgi:NADH-quinone oxidoreductase subunit H
MITYKSKVFMSTLVNNLSAVVDLIFFVLLFLSLIIVVAYFTLYERKIMAAIQRRRGPDNVGFFGLFQPLVDGIKLLCKQVVIAKPVVLFIFIISPFFVFFVSLLV